MPAEHDDRPLTHGRRHLQGQATVPNEHATPVDGHPADGQLGARDVERTDDGADREASQVCCDYRPRVHVDD